MSRAVFSHTDTVMRENKNRAHTHQRGQSHRRAHVIGKGQECCRIRNDAAVQGHAYGNRAHRVFAHAEMNITSLIAPGAADHSLQTFCRKSRALKITETFEPGKSRRIQVSRTAGKFGNFSGDGLHDYFSRFARGHIF